MDAELMAVFTKETERLMQAMAEAIKKLKIAQDNGPVLEEIQRSAHTLKGNYAQFGFEPESKVFAELEGYTKNIRIKNTVHEDDINFYNLRLEAAKHNVKN